MAAAAQREYDSHQRQATSCDWRSFLQRRITRHRPPRAQRLLRELLADPPRCCPPERAPRS